MKLAYFDDRLPSLQGETEEEEAWVHWEVDMRNPCSLTVDELKQKIDEQESEVERAFLGGIMLMKIYAQVIPEPVQ